VAEVFFANLFRAWSEKPGNPLLEAFDVAVRELDPYLDRVRGSGVTLWTSEPLLEDDKAISFPMPEKKESENAGSESDGPAPLELEFDVKPYPALNYSVLHNGKSKMFESFRGGVHYHFLRRFRSLRKDDQAQRCGSYPT